MSQTVLVADDSKTIRQIVEMALKASSWEVVGVTSAQDAMQAAREAPSVILLDYYMPDGSGYDVCRALKQDSSTRTIPIVMLGGSYKAFDESLARDAGADIVLMKPFKTDALLKALEDAQNAEVALPLPTFAEPEPDPPTAESEPHLDLDSDSEEVEYGYGYGEAGDEQSSEPVIMAAPEPAFDSEADSEPQPAYEIPDEFPDEDDDDELPRPGGTLGAMADSTPLPQPSSQPSSQPASQPRIPTEPARGSSPDINATSRPPASTVAPVATGAALSREDIEHMIREEVKAAVKNELPGLLRNVMGEIFQQKIMPKLTEHADARINAVVNEQMTSQIQSQVRVELERLLSEE